MMNIPSVYLKGYEGESVENLVSELKKNKIEVLFDVRETPHSRKWGFSGRQLSKILKDNNISYYHFGKLGSPKYLRDNYYKKNDFISFFKQYRKHLENNIDSLDRLSIVAAGRNSCVFCFEKEHEQCHRNIIAGELLRRSNQRIVPL